MQIVQTLRQIIRLPHSAVLIWILIVPLWVAEWGPTKFHNIKKPDDTSTHDKEKKTVKISDPIDFPSDNTLKPVIKTLHVAKGDTIGNLLLSAGLSNNQVQRIILNLSRLFDPKRIRPGDKLIITYQPLQSDDSTALETPRNDFKKIQIIPDPTKEYLIKYEDNKTFSIRVIKKSMQSLLVRTTGTIKNNLYASAVSAGVPLPILMEFIRIYSWDVDFQRSIRVDDKFDILYERYISKSGEFSHYGNILYTHLKLGNDFKRLYRFTDTTKLTAYYDERGRSARKALLRTPINGARLTSGFGTRRHPVLGYNKMHRGVDFAAPRNTPIFAAGSGTVVYRSNNGHYGKYIRIRHNSRYSTAYAHLQKFKRSVTKGSRVKQGQTIGYVGTTGRSTGPHLHYEILYRGRQINPMRVKMPSGRSLKGSELTTFKKLVAEINGTLKKQLPNKK